MGIPSGGSALVTGGVVSWRLPSLEPGGGRLAILLLP
jgi:hypothetical protein